MVNNTWGEGRKITQRKSHPVQSYVLLPLIFVLLERKNPFASTTSHWWKEVLNVSEIPSDPLPAKALYESSFHMSVEKQAGI